MPRTDRPTYVLIALWLLAMVSIPIQRWVLGDWVLPWGVSLMVLLQTAASLAALRTAWGGMPTLRAVAIVLPLSWLLEWIGSTTGLPFGHYHYTEALRPQLLGVPLLIPLAWLMMLPPAWAVATWITGGKPLMSYLLTAALAFTAWDLYLDPQMVTWGFWEWDQPGLYFGIPLVNFFGWVLGAFLLSLAVRPAPLPSTPLLAIYTLTWFMQMIGLALFWEMPGPAAVGFVAMGLFVMLGWRGWQVERQRVAAGSSNGAALHSA